MKSKIKRSILAVLHACDGVPMPETVLLAAVQLHVRPEGPTESDIADALKDATEGKGHVVALSFKERSAVLPGVGQ